MEDEVSLAIHQGPALIDDDQMFPGKLPRQPCGRSNLEGCSSDNQQLRVPDQPAGVIMRFLGQKLPVEGHVRPDHATTFEALGLAGAVKNEVNAIGGIAPSTVVAPRRSVNLLDVDASRFLMEPVDVLSDDPVQPAVLLPLGED